MNIAVCESNEAALRQIVRWIEQYCQVYEIYPDVSGFRQQDELHRSLMLRRYDIVFTCYDGPDGFLGARRIRETDKSVKIVFVSDTTEYAYRGMRLHFSDYIVKPVEFKDIVRSMKLIGIGRG